MSSVPQTMYLESVVRNEQRGMTIADELSVRFTYHSKEEWLSKIEQGLVTLNGVVATPEMIVMPKDKVVYRVDNYTEPEVPTDFETLYEDDDFLIVSKPAGIPVHHTGHIFYNTFTGVIRRAFKNEELSLPPKALLSEGSRFLCSYISCSESSLDLILKTKQS